MAAHTAPVLPLGLAASSSASDSLTPPAPRLGEWSCETGFVSDLLVRCGRDDPGALALLYDVLSPIVTAVVSLNVDQSRVGDSVRDVFVEVWRDAPAYPAGRSSAVEWIMDRVATVSTRLDPARAVPDGLADAG